MASAEGVGAKQDEEREEEIKTRLDHARKTMATVLHLDTLNMGMVPKALSFIGHYPCLRVLDMRDNQLVMLPSAMFTILTHLEELRLQNNQLSYLPESLSDLHQLKVLNLSNNALEEMPEGLFVLEQLEKLNISDNRLEVLVPHFGLLTHLKELLLARNPFSVVPPELKALTELTRFDVSGNPITIIPETLQRLHAKGELLRDKERRKGLIRRALAVRTRTRAAYRKQILGPSPLLGGVAS